MALRFEYINTPYKHEDTEGWVTDGQCLFTWYDEDAQLANGEISYLRERGHKFMCIPLKALCKLRDMMHKNSIEEAEIYLYTVLLTGEV